MSQFMTNEKRISDTDESRAVDDRRCDAAALQCGEQTLGTTVDQSAIAHLWRFDRSVVVRCVLAQANDKNMDLFFNCTAFRIKVAVMQSFHNLKTRSFVRFNQKESKSQQQS